MEVEWKIIGLGFRGQGLGFRVQGLGLGFRVQGLGWGLGMRVYDLRMLFLRSGIGISA